MTTAVIIEFDQVRLERLPESELREEIKRREPEPFEKIAEGHPLIAPKVKMFKRSVQGAEWCKERLQRIADRIAKYFAKHDQARVWDSVQRLAHRAVGSVSAGEQWLARQQRQMARTERVRDLRQVQIKTLASDVRELAEQLRLEIEHALGKQVLAQRRVYGELARREIEDRKRVLASEAQR